MEIQFRDVQPTIERDTILEFHCINNYESESPLFRTIPYEEYRKQWLATPQPEEVLRIIEKDLKDSRNIVQFVQIDNEAVGFLWLRFNDIDMGPNEPTYTIADVYGLGVKAEYHRQGIATKILSYIETQAREKGANLIRSGAGIDNFASQKLHEKYGFCVYQMLYEKEV